MIVFDGVSLNSVAGIKIKDIHVSPIQYDEITRPRAIQGGSVFVRSRAGIRTVQITFALLDENEISRQASLMALSQWAKDDKEYKLELPGHPEFYLMAVCTEKPSPSLREWWESGLRLVFTCFENPYWISKAEKSVSTNTQFTVLGNAPPLMRIERTVSEAVANQGYSNGNESMIFSTTPAGSLVVDLNRQTAAVSGTDIMQYYYATNSFLIPRTGTQTISGIGTIKFRERWK
jgi:phage-related protein